jgi:hypothetical protein
MKTEEKCKIRFIGPMRIGPTTAIVQPSQPYTYLKIRIYADRAENSVGIFALYCLPEYIATRRMHLHCDDPSAHLAAP